MRSQDVDAVMERFGRGELTAAEAAAEVLPAYGAAIAERDARRASGDNLGLGPDPDAASTPDSFTSVHVARWTGVITMDQYNALMAALP